MNERQLSFYIVDDDPNMVAMMTLVLEASGHVVASTTDSSVALTEIVKHKPDCVLLDLMMPGIDGLDLCQAIGSHEKLRATRIIIVSGKPYEFDRKRALKLGAHGYIVKPIDPEAFARQVERFVDDHIIMTFWGVRGTLPVPGERALRYGGNTNCMTLEFTRGQFFVFDAGTGIKALSDHLMRAKRMPMEGKIFISHPHWDHINALPFFVPLYITGNEFEILGASHNDTTMRELIAAQMEGIYFPITLKEFGARVYFHNLGEGTLTVDNIKIHTKLLSHPGKCLGYRMNYGGRSICYVTDNEFYLKSSPHHNPHYVERLRAFVAGADVLVTDATYTDEEYPRKVGWGHSCITEVVNFAHQAEVKTLYLHHHDPDQSDDDIDAKLAKARSLLARLGSATKVVAPVEGQSFTI